ncbi:MAG: sulfotransferase domain-containing protein [Planctomycetota bacterium]
MKPRFADVRDKLRFVTWRSDDEPDLELFPDFMIIGPQRTGTTWLHENLIEHPQVLMLVEKELYYFNNLRTDEFHPAHLPPVQQELQWYLDFFRPTEDFVAQRERECQERYGEPYDIAVRGEGTATYAVALSRDPQILTELLTLNPRIKIMTMVRNPADRAWSHAKKDLAKLRNRNVQDVPDSEWLEFLQRDYQVACGHYTHWTRRWLERLPEEQLFVGRFDEIVSSPAKLLSRAYEFLGIRAAPAYVGKVAKQRVNPTETAEMPPAVQELLDSQYGEEIERLRAMGMLEGP